MKRRSFLQTLASLPLFLSAKKAAAAASAVPGQFINLGNEVLKQKVFGHPQFEKNQAAIMQGMTTESTAQFIVLRPKASQWRYEVLSPDKSEVKTSAVKTAGRKFSDWCVDRLTVSELNIGTTYRLNVVDLETQTKIDDREFSALDRSTNQIRFAMASCMNDENHESQMVMWPTLVDEKPQMIFLLGDTVYADDNTTDFTEVGIWNRYVETRQLLSIFRADKLIPILAIWDDHDFGRNGSDGSYPLKKKTLKIFNDFFGSEETDGLSFGPGVSKLFEGFGQRIFMMDSRYFRTPKFSGGSMWGEKQEEWLLDNLSRSSKPAWIFNGSQFFGGYRFKDGYEFAFNKSFWEMMKRLRETGVPIALGSGDVHISEIMEIEKEVFGYKSFELTSSSIHSSTNFFKDKIGFNKRRLASVWQHNFMIIESAAKPAGFAIDVKSVSAGGVINFRKVLDVDSGL